MRIALLGAGFTRNWGGWLASEIVGELCGRVHDDNDLLRMLKMTRNFEQVLGEVRQQANRGPSEQRRFERLQQAVLETFEEMNQMLAAQDFEFFAPGNPGRWLVTFLAEFDAIFTLNQDLMLELHYVPGRTVPDRRKWRATAYPGIVLPNKWLDAAPPERLGPVLSEADKHDHDPQDQPIYKLHGSVNWRTKDGTPIVVIGGSKDESIRGSSLLSGYLEAFRKYLSAGNTRLMIIGYGFADEHVNTLIKDASLSYGLQTYLVNPAGLSVFDPPPHALIAPVNETFNAMRLTGIMTRPFRDAFRVDELLFHSLWRFMNGEPPLKTYV